MAILILEEDPRQVLAITFNTGIEISQPLDTTVRSPIQL